MRNIFPTVLNSRLSELREAGIIQLREGGGYVITEEGMALGKIIARLDSWAKRWSERPAFDGTPELQEPRRVDSGSAQ